MPDHAVSYSIILNRLGRSDESIERLTAGEPRAACGRQSDAGRSAPTITWRVLS